MHIFFPNFIDFISLSLDTTFIVHQQVSPGCESVGAGDLSDRCSVDVHVESSSRMDFLPSNPDLLDPPLASTLAPARLQAEELAAQPLGEFTVLYRVYMYMNTY